ncbi:MAG: glucosyl-3-phosphoglycerate synthase [Methanohalobium sp.]|uniref:glucosyl-3-phosphoglycerate synthase n=1 Tax=Methanohalobium sp. TaxID=2837493 RepID=UPI00397A754B
MDFSQERITTIHDCGINGQKIADRISKLSLVRPSVVIIPMLYDEIKSDSLQLILDQLNKSNYIKQITIALSAEDSSQYREVLDFFGKLHIPHIVVWCNGPRIQKIMEEMKEKELDITPFTGKGKDVWIAIGVASLYGYAIAFHDADIKTYDKYLPAKLLYPIIEPELDFFYNKGYYARIDIESRQMFGRVHRLFVEPLIETVVKDINKSSEILRYLQAFRYPLSGEFAMTKDLAMNIRIPSDWGFEVGLLGEVYRNTTMKRISQIDLGFYNHKHQSMGSDVSEGLSKMANDIFITFIRLLSENTNIQISIPLLHSISVKYKRLAQDLIRQYHADAICNDLKYNRHQEETHVDTFADIIQQSKTEYFRNTSDVLMPDWKRALSAIPNLNKRFRNAALEDCIEYSKYNTTK